MKNKKAICMVSGGIDSAVAVAVLSNNGYKTHFIHFDYGQKTNSKELECARAIAKHFDSDLKVVKVPFLKELPGISLTTKDTRTTAINEYVPNRNAILESQAVAYAEFLKAGIVCIGSIGSDNICPDNSPKFIEAMQSLINQGTMLKPPIQIIAPLINFNKADVVKKGLELKIPFESTWSCHNKVDFACGICSNCISRIDAFDKNNSRDPVMYKNYEK